MLFNSVEYLIFLPIVLFCYWFIFNKSLKAQNAFLLVCSYVFYAWWDWRFLFLLALSTFIDYYFGLILSKRETKRKLYLWLCVINNLGILFIFKYFNFFIDSTTVLINSVGYTVEPYILNIVLPVGISFYTFHGMSYVFDIYNRKIEPTKNFVTYSLFVAFFPLLVAGPIERAHHLLPQIKVPRVFKSELFFSGIKLMLFGFFKKMVVADSVAPVVNNIFENYDTLSGATLVYGAVLFAFQIYGDFCGYTDIARGSARLMGIELLTNFRFPYFSRDIAEFWRRWHISLSLWFRDYLYIPLGGSREGKLKAIRNTFIIFLVSGFWHGANWTFIFWGFLHALYFLPQLLASNNRKHLDDNFLHGGVLTSTINIFKVLFTFLLVCFAWIFFRASSIGQAFDYIGNFTVKGGIAPHLLYRFDVIMIGIMLVIDYLIYAKKQLPAFVETLIYCFLFISVAAVFAENKFQNSFIYFQF